MYDKKDVWETVKGVVWAIAVIPILILEIVSTISMIPGMIGVAIAEASLPENPKWCERDK